MYDSMSKDRRLIVWSKLVSKKAGLFDKWVTLQKVDTRPDLRMG